MSLYLLAVRRRFIFCVRHPRELFNVFPTLQKLKGTANPSAAASGKCFVKNTLSGANHLKNFILVQSSSNLGYF